MEFADVVRRRRMVRRYDPQRPVEAGVLERMLDHAHRAPSAGNTQGRAFLLLDTAADVRRFWTATSPDPEAGNRWLDGMRTAPVVIVALADRDAYLDRYAEPDKGHTDRDEARWPVPWWHVDAGMSALLLLQTAVDEGLGACFFGVPGERWAQFRAAFAVPERLVPVGAVTVGHRVPGDVGSAGSAGRGRPPLERVVHRGRWREA